MFVNFRISVTVIGSLLARSRAPKHSESGTIYPPLIQSESGTIYPPLIQLPLLQRALFSEIFSVWKIIFNPPKCL